MVVLNYYLFQQQFLHHHFLLVLFELLQIHLLLLLLLVHLLHLFLLELFDLMNQQYHLNKLFYVDYIFLLLMYQLQVEKSVVQLLINVVYDRNILVVQLLFHVQQLMMYYVMIHLNQDHLNLQQYYLVVDYYDFHDLLYLN
jgi:hypothetical protein